MDTEKNFSRQLYYRKRRKFMSNNVFYNNAIEATAVGTAIAKDIIKEGTSLRKKIVKFGSAPEEEAQSKDLIGLWKYDSFELGDYSGIKVNYSKENYSFEFDEKGNAVAFIHGILYKTTYELDDGCITFGNAALAALKVTLSDGKLQMGNLFVGIALNFVKAN
jgi:hypothetical protein